MTRVQIDFMEKLIVNMCSGSFHYRHRTIDFSRELFVALSLGRTGNEFSIPVVHLFQISKATFG
ncbi:hypothetical protein D3C83_190610 [compost metagenome]